MRRSSRSFSILASSALVLTLTMQGAWAQSSTPAPAPAAASAAAPAGSGAAATNPNPVIATVNGQAIHLQDLQEMTRNLPQQLQSMPAEQLYPILLNQLVDQTAMAIVAKKQGLMQEPDVQRRIEIGTEQVLQGALIRKVIGPEITPAAIKAVYDKDYANKPGAEEIHARHILVKTEAQAEDIIKQLDHGADFAKLADKYSTDPGNTNGGDLGWFKKGDMVPAFADAAFAMKDGQITQKPVHTQFGWHVIQVLGHRTAPTPTLADVQDKIKEQIIQKGIHQLLTQVRSQVTIKEYAPDGSALPTEAAPAAAGPASGSAAGAATPASK
ncbi:peptidylprolyl isomerase [Acidisoma sp. C75]